AGADRVRARAVGALLGARQQPRGGEAARGAGAPRRGGLDQGTQGPRLLDHAPIDRRADDPADQVVEEGHAGRPRRGIPILPGMSAPTAEVVICGAGIAAIAAPYPRGVRRGVTGAVLVDEGPPLSLTSDKSTECYRNWWPGPGDDMVALMNRSIDLLEELARESDDRFLLNRRGYLFATADPARATPFHQHAI